jgi:para-nitrobenzyl esterase
MTMISFRSCLRFTFLLAAAALASCGESSTPLTGGSGTTVTTRLGRAEGFRTEDGAVAFLGLPFAEPPVGELRFRPPVPVRSWSDPLDATAFGPACPQPLGANQSLYLEQSEDCLTLNVWTPSVDRGARPVMVWIHGGGWIYEGTEDRLYDGGRLAVRGDIVVVSVAYRLGALGFTHLEGVEGSGNAGILDQKLALEWVREHIGHFGGDPNNVTIFGESAGGMSVSALMGMPSARGLFHKAIAQSNVASLARRADYASRVTALLLKKAGAANREELMSRSWPELLQAQIAVSRENFPEDLLYGPVVDGTVFPRPPVQAVREGLSAHIPLLLGTNRDEARYWMVDNPLLAAPFPPQFFVALVPVAGRAIPDDRSVQEAIALYTRAQPDFPPNFVALAAATDIFFRMPVLRFAEAQLGYQPDNVFVYRFDWPPPNPAAPALNLGATHGSELAFVFDSAEGWPELYGSGVPSGLVEHVMDAWIAFARTGDPNHAGMPAWPAYDMSRRPAMIFDTTPTVPTSAVVYDPDALTRPFWDGIPFDGVRPAMLPEDL